MKLRRVSFASFADLCFCIESIAHSQSIAHTFPTNSHFCSVRIFDCSRQEAVAANQGPRPHAYQALKVDCQEVSLRQRKSCTLVDTALPVCVSFVCVCLQNRFICCRSVHLHLLREPTPLTATKCASTSVSLTSIPLLRPSAPWYDFLDAVVCAPQPSHWFCSIFVLLYLVQTLMFMLSKMSAPY